MSSNHTEHYSLSQWEAEDKVLRTDFNEDNAKIDAALSQHAGALALRGNCQIEIQTYIGTATAQTTKCLTFSARPAFVFIMGQDDVRWLNGTSNFPLFLGGYKAINFGLTLTPGSAHWEGNTAVLGPDDPRIAMNQKDRYYFVIAFIPKDMEITSGET